MAILVRPAHAGDAAFVAWTMLAASRSHLPRGAWDLGLAMPDPECLSVLEEIAHEMPPSFCSWRHFLVAEVDGTPGAALSAYDPGRIAPADPAIDAVVLRRGWTQADIDASNRRLVPFMTCAPGQPEGTWVVEWVATRPALRRRGLIDALLPEVLDVGRRRGYREAQIAILMGNTPAQRAYEKQGFRIAREITHPDFAAAMGCPGIAELHRRL
jgi:translation initiation factor 4G